MKRTHKLLRPVSGLLVLVTLLFLAAGCSGGGSGTYTPDELKTMLANALVTTSGAASFHHDLSFIVNGETPGDSGTPGTFDVSLNSQGTADIAENEMQTELKVSFGMKIGDQDSSSQEVSGQIYQVGGYLYLLPEQGGNGSWRKTPATTLLTQAYGMNLIQSQFTMLASPVSIEYVKEEKLDGTTCRMLSITPDTDLLTQWLRQQGALPSEGIDWSNTSALTDLFQNVTIQVWIAKDSGFIRKLSAVIAAQVDEAMTGDSTSPNNMGVDINLSLALSDYNQPVTITLPPDAQNAPEVSEQDFTFF